MKLNCFFKTQLAYQFKILYIMSNTFIVLYISNLVTLDMPREMSNLIIMMQHGWNAFKTETTFTVKINWDRGKMDSFTKTMICSQFLKKLYPVLKTLCLLVAFTLIF